MKCMKGSFGSYAIAFTLASVAVAEPRGASAEEKAILRRTSESFRSIARTVAPAVVNIRSTKQVGQDLARRHTPGGDSYFPPEFREFFDHFSFPQPDSLPSPQTGIGSGFVIDKKGHIVTNHHVVDGATSLLVSFSGDIKEYKAQVVGQDPRTDLAVIKLTGITPRVATQWAEASSVEVGDWAVAIGSPFALGNTVTVGIVSAKGRKGELFAGTELSGELLQTDAAINPGNSGGPLCDIDGRVMGVNTAIYSRSGGYMGIGFAIPSNLAKEISSKLITDGKIVRGWLGVVIQPLEDSLAKELGIQQGAVIREVAPKSPASNAGLKAGEAIVEVEGKRIADPAALQKQIGSLKPGQTVNLKVVSYQTKEARTVSVKIAAMPEQPARS